MAAIGIQQEDPVGAALFLLGNDNRTRKLETEFNVWYFDYKNLGHSPEKVFAVVTKLVNGLRVVAVELNRKKGESTILSHPEEEIQTCESFNKFLPEH